MVANNKLTYLIDGNFYLHKTLSVTGVFDQQYPRFLKGDDKVKQEEDKNVLLGKLAMDFCSDIRKSSKLLEDIIITYDDYSWRNDFFNDKAYKYASTLPDEYLALTNPDHIPASLEEGDSEHLKAILDEPAAATIDYKGTRTKDKVVDWSAIYATFEMFLKDVEKVAGVRWVRIGGCEGDDIVFVVSAHFNALGKNVMIYSGDNDLKQLINHDKTTNAFTIHHKKTESKVVMHPETARWLMNSSSNIKNALNAFTNDNNITLSAEFPYEIMFDKILCGDKGDNVFSIMEEPRQYKSGQKKGQWKNVRMTPSIVKKIKAEIDYGKYTTMDFFNDDFNKLIANSAIRNFKPQNPFTTENIVNNIEINRDLMFLHKRCLPHSIYESMVEWAHANKDDSKLNTRELYSYKVLQEKMEHYTKSEEDSASSASFFKNLGL